MWSKMALVLVLMLAFHGVRSASLPMLPNPVSTEGRSDVLTDPSDVSDAVLDALAARLEASDTIDALSQEASDRLSDFSSSRDAQSVERTPSEASEIILTNPLDTLASKLNALPNPLDTLDIISTLGSEKVRRSVLEDVKQLIESKFTALLEDGVKRIAGKRGILKKGLTLTPTSRSSLVLKVKGENPDSTSEEQESHNSGVMKDLTNGLQQESSDTELRNVVDELLGEEEDKTIEKDILNSNEDHLNTENSMSDKNGKTNEDYDDITSESSRKASYVVEKNLSETTETNKNGDKTVEVEKILDLDEIVKLALKDLSDSSSQENLNEDSDKDRNLTTELEAKNDQSDVKLSEIEKSPQIRNELGENVENILRQGNSFVELDDDGIEAYKTSNIDIDENVLHTEKSSSTHQNQNEDDGQNLAKLLRQGQNLGNLILFNKNITLSDLKNHDNYITSKTSHPSQSDKPIGAYQSLINGNGKSSLKHDYEQNNHNKISEVKKYVDLAETIVQPENQNEVNAYYDKNEYIKGETKHAHQQITQQQVKKHHHHHHHYHHHHHNNNNKLNKLIINKNNSDDIPISKADATQENIYSGELKSYNTENKLDHPKQETEEKNNENNAQESKTGLQEENDFTYEDNNVAKERKSILEDDKNNLEVHDVPKEKTSVNKQELENETSKTRTATKHTLITGGQSEELVEEGSNADDLIDEINEGRSGIGEIIYITDDNEKLNLNIANGRQGTEEKVIFAEKDLKGTEDDDVTAEDRHGCHNKKNHKQIEKSDENDATNVLQDLVYNKDKIKSYTLSMTFTTTK